MVESEHPGALFFVFINNKIKKPIGVKRCAFRVPPSALTPHPERFSFIPLTGKKSYLE